MNTPASHTHHLPATSLATLNESLQLCDLPVGTVFTRFIVLCARPDSEQVLEYLGLNAIDRRHKVRVVAGLNYGTEWTMSNELVAVA